MNTRPRRFHSFHCKLTDAQIDQIKVLADTHDTPYTEMTRRLINHALTCPFFVPETSSGRNPQSTESGK